MNFASNNQPENTIIVDKTALFRVYNACVTAQHTLSFDEFENLRGDLLKLKISLEASTQQKQS